MTTLLSKIKFLTFFSAFALSASFQAATAAPSGSSISPKRVDTQSSDQLRMVVKQGEISYENATITEDVTWRGTVVIRGSLMISSLATVRIDPGTNILFVKSAILRQSPRMVVSGRLQCSGKPENPVVFTSSKASAVRGEWGGILFLSSEKRNQMEHFRIEGADTAIEAHYSNLNVNGAKIRLSGTGILLHDSNVTFSKLDISGLETGLESHNSEVDLRESVFSDNVRGLVAGNTSLSAISVYFSGNKQHGVVADESRIRMRSCRFTDNTAGALIKGGEGQILRCSFSGNHQLALDLSGGRIKINNSLFTQNLRDAIRVNDSRSLIQGNDFSKNQGHNIVNLGNIAVVAVQNWWDSKEESVIKEKILNTVKNTSSGTVVFSPWLMQKPSL